MSLQISPTLSLPDDAVTQTFAILARKGAGKSYCAGVMAEEMGRNHLPFIWVDPVGAAFGFRSSADGKRPGLPIVILGGEHGDLPLAPEAGEQVAKFIVSENVSILLDLSLMRKGEQVRFMTGFTEAIYHLNKAARHIFMDEVDLFAPQRPFPEGMRLLGSIEDIVRRGRIKGLGFTSITQRAAVVNKDVLTQTECLIVLQTTGPQDKKAVKEWVNVHVDDPASKQVAEFERSLPNLNKGQAWIWSPAWLKTFKLVQIRRKDTFDSSATPKPGQLSKPKVIAEVDLGKLQTQMSSVIEEQRANDPRELKRQIAELKRELAKPQPAPKPVIDIDPIVAVAVKKALSEQAKLYETKLIDFSGRIQAICKEQLSLNGIESFAATYKPQIVQRAAPPSTSRAVQSRQTKQASGPGEKLPVAERKILTVLAQFGARTKIQVAILTGYAHSGGGFNNALSALRTKGYMSGSEQLQITEDGISALGSWEPLPTGRDLLAYWMNREGKAERTILQVLADKQSLSKSALAEQCGYAETGGGFNNALSRLRTLELISGSRDLTIAEELLD